MNEEPAACETYVHATAVVVGEAGVLLRGPSGSGKTALALALIEEARREGRFARLVADDRVGLRIWGGRLVARPHPAIAGLVERRGLGIVPILYEPACVIALVADLRAAGAADGARLPEAAAFETELLGLRLPALVLPGRGERSDQSRLILELVPAFRPGS